MKSTPPDTPFGPPDVTPAVKRATRAVSETAYGVGVEMADREIAVDALDAALDVEEMRAAIAAALQPDEELAESGIPRRAAEAIRAALLGEEAKIDLSLHDVRDALNANVVDHATIVIDQQGTPGAMARITQLREALAAATATDPALAVIVAAIESRQT